VTFAACALLAVVGCGNDNGQACEDYVQKVTDCGDETVSATYTDAWCEPLKELDCDISGYFDCMSEALGECKDKNFPDIDATAAAACASQATCS
jgi:hypothetical protein